MKNIWITSLYISQKQGKRRKIYIQVQQILRDERNHCVTIAQLEKSHETSTSEKGDSETRYVGNHRKRSLDSGKETDSRGMFRGGVSGDELFSRWRVESVVYQRVVHRLPIDRSDASESTEETPISGVERRCIRAIYHESLRDSTHQCNDRALLHLPGANRRRIGRSRKPLKELMTVTSFPYLGRDCCATRNAPADASNVSLSLFFFSSFFFLLVLPCKRKNVKKKILDVRGTKRPQLFLWKSVEIFEYQVYDAVFVNTILFRYCKIAALLKTKFSKKNPNFAKVHWLVVKIS